MHVELLVEEESAAAAMEILLPKLLPRDSELHVIRFQGKPDLLAQLPNRLRGYANWNVPELRVVILVDRDDDDCKRLKQNLEGMCRNAGLKSKTSSRNFTVATCIAVEELEAWFFGDVPALVAAFPRLPPTLGAKAPYRDPDRISGGTWQALERELQAVGYFRNGLGKIATASAVAVHMDVGANRSASFRHFAATVRAL